MSKKSHSALRRQGYKLSPLKTVSLRVQPELWQKCGWSAAANGVDRSEFVRDTLASATRDAKPPIPQEFERIPGGVAERAEWEKWAEHLGLSLNDFMGQAADLVCKRLAAKVAAEAADRSAGEPD